MLTNCEEMKNTPKRGRDERHQLPKCEKGLMSSGAFVFGVPPLGLVRRKLSCMRRRVLCDVLESKQFRDYVCMRFWE